MGVFIYLYIEIKNLNKIYRNGEGDLKVVNDVSLNIKKGQFVIILGPSGSGKSSLMNLIGGIDRPNSGDILIDGKDIVSYSNKELNEYRREKLGFVFQFYNLIQDLSVEENIKVCQYISKNPLDVNGVIEKVGLKGMEKKYPNELSGGQQQRVSIARAIVKNPQLLLCDEPTGSLDYKTSKEILKLLVQLNKDYNTTIIMITHNEAIKDLANLVVKIKDGKVFSSKINERQLNIEEIEW